MTAIMIFIVIIVAAERLK